MIAKAVVTALSIQDTDFPSVKAGERPWQTFTYYDRETDRDPAAVTVLIDRQIAPETFPAEFEEVVAVLQIEQVARAVKRQDREDGSRTYDSVSNQLKARVVAFEPVAAKGNGKAAAPPAKAAA